MEQRESGHQTAARANATPLEAIAAADALVVKTDSAILLTADGEIRTLPLKQAAAQIAGKRLLVCHAGLAAGRLGLPPFVAYDLLELFAFVYPARFVLPTPAGLAAFLNLPIPKEGEDEAVSLVAAARALLAAVPDLADRPNAQRVAAAMARAGWPWGAALLSLIGMPPDASSGNAGLDVWNRLSEWEEQPHPPPPGDVPVGEQEARDRLTVLAGAAAEQRLNQSDYAALSAEAFKPRQQQGVPQVVLAEAGTGIGKTLGYIAAASCWSEKNDGTVWISTFTKNLQRQIDQELDRLYPDPGTKQARIVVRKGRENYLCLLNMEDAVRSAGAAPAERIALGLLARWALATRDGDMIGGDFPAWLIDLLGRRHTRDLTDHWGECIYSACPHYRKCFVERVVRRTRGADMVIANHALVMYQATVGDDADTPRRYVFDEGHHVFDAADSTFAAYLSGQEGQALRRWVRGHESGRRTARFGSRSRGLAARYGDLIEEGSTAEGALDALNEAVRVLPAEGWLARIQQAATEDSDGATPRNAAENFLARVLIHVMARTQPEVNRYSLDAAPTEPAPELLTAAGSLHAALARIRAPIAQLQHYLHDRLDKETDSLETGQRLRMESAIKALQRRDLHILGAWQNMLQDIGEQTPENFVDWFTVDRQDGRIFDIGYRRHWIDPTVPFAEAVMGRAHGVLITSATLRDTARTEADTWVSAESRAGTVHLPTPPLRGSLPSPFNYAENTRILIVNDIRRTDPRQIAAAYRELFLASNGGALGLFTAIQRLRDVHRHIQEPLALAGLPLWAQHVDPMDTGTLVDIFRAEANSCLLGTDAVRDGVDVPGEALRLIVFDRVPWPRTDLLHRARRNRFGKGKYDDRLARLRLKQAYGRLVRRREDRGIFVILDAMTPSRLLDAFPEGVRIDRIGIAEATARVRQFFTESA